MAITGIFFGSDTGNTENIAKMIQKQLGKDVADVHDIAKSSKEDLEAYDILLLGIPTWYYGEAQCDWDDFFPTLEEIDFNGKLVALFGCGDQEDYAEYFCDALGTIRDIIEPRGATIVGHWPTAGYHFEASKGLATILDLLLLYLYNVPVFKWPCRCKCKLCHVFINNICQGLVVFI